MDLFGFKGFWVSCFGLGDMLESFTVWNLGSGLIENFPVAPNPSR